MSNVILRVVETNNCVHPKVCKSHCPKTARAIILMTTSHLLEATSVPGFTMHQGGCTQGEAVHKRRLYAKGGCTQEEAVYKRGLYARGGSMQEVAVYKRRLYARGDCMQDKRQFFLKGCSHPRYNPLAINALPISSDHS